MDDFEKELKVGFLDEAAQLLSDSEQAFLDLEKASDDPSIIERIFRLAHNLKGSARAVGFGEMAEFTHEFESLLLKIRKGELEIRSATVSLLLRCNDHLKGMVDALRGNLNASVDSSAIISDISAHVGAIAKISKPVAPVETPLEEPLLPVPPASAFIEMADGPVSRITGVDAAQFEDLDAKLAAVAGQSGEEVILKKVTPALAVPVVAASPQATPVSPVAPAAQDESIRVSLKRLERLMNNVGELVILQAVLNQQKAAVGSLFVQKTIDQLGKITKDIQDISMSLRMVPLRQTFQKMQRIIRDTSKALNKDVALELSGEDTELDKTVLEQVGDPLVHLIRNAVDHGLETTEQRLAVGKPPQGTVQLKAYHRGSHIAIEVSDDGFGLDPKKLIGKAIERGIVRPGAVLSDEDAYKLIFASGFSTKEQITDISGRGVGMDVVRNNIQALQGDIQIETELGKGTTFRIMLPLTLSIIDGMVIRAAGQRYIVPIAQVFESVQPSEEDVQTVSGVGEVLVLRGENIPLFRLPVVLGRDVKNAKLSESIAIVIRTNKSAHAMLVDEIIGNQQVVIKRLGNEVQHLKGISGGAILGDGKASLILDFHELVHRAMTMQRTSDLVRESSDGASDGSRYWKGAA